MARPRKEGLDYFPLVTRFEDKVDLIIAEYGAAGLGIVVGLYQKIFTHGYYCEWDDDVLMLYSRYVNEEKTLVSSVINRCFDRKILDKTMYEKHGILTSRGIQKQFLRVCRDTRRHHVKMIREYCLVDDPELLKLITEFTSVSSEETGVNNGGNSDKNIVPYTDLGTKTPKEKEKGKEKSTLGSSEQGSDSFKGNEELKYPEGSKALGAALYLRGKILENNPREKTPSDDPKDKQLQKWAAEMDKLNRLGPVGADSKDGKGYSWKEIAAIIDWCQDHRFWKINIKSPGKLREKIATLEDQRREEEDGQSKRNSKKAGRAGYQPSAGDWEAERSESI